MNGHQWAEDCRAIEAKYARAIRMLERTLTQGQPGKSSKSPRTLKAIKNELKSLRKGLSDLPDTSVRLLREDPDLKDLNDILSEFNLFHVLGGERNENQHSNFLAYLMDSRQNHQLGGCFLKHFLIHVRNTTAKNGPRWDVKEEEIEQWDCDREFTISRETGISKCKREGEEEGGRLDLQMVNPSRSLVVVIENKIDTQDSPGQLKKYRKDAEERYHGYKILCLYLTPDGREPCNAGDEKCHWLCVGYQSVWEAVGDLLNVQGNRRIEDKKLILLLRDYHRLLGTEIIRNDERVKALCSQLQAKHRAAICLVRGWQWVWLYEKMCSLIVKSGLSLRAPESDICISRIPFCPQEWVEPLQKNPSTITKKRDVLLTFVFKNDDNAGLELSIDPSKNPPHTDVMRQRLEKALQTWLKTHVEPFNNLGGKGEPGGHIVPYVKAFPKHREALSMDIGALSGKIEDKWRAFVEKDLPEIKKCFSSVLVR